MSWESEDKVRRRRWTRRDFVKVGLAAGAATVAGAVVADSLLTPSPPSELSSAILYLRFPEPAWWNAMAGTAMKVTDFAVWEGASGVLGGTVVNGQIVAGSGLPVLVIRVPRDDTNFTSPPLSGYPFVDGFALYLDDATRGIRIVAVYDRCAHLCCYPGWHVYTSGFDRNYVAPCPTYQVYGQDPVVCICHGSQYDPMVLVQDVNPVNGVTYVGAQRVHEPAPRAIPVVALKAVDDVLYGLQADPRWYVYC
jgi:Rieske Fe-S protein